MKPTQVKCAVGSLNQLPPWTEISGDVRLTPFYDVGACRAAMDGHVAALNADLSVLRTWGPMSRYEIEGARGALELTWGEGSMEGIAVSLESEGNAALLAATAAVLGEQRGVAL